MPDDAPWTVGRLLQWTAPFFARKEVDAPRLSAELLLAHVLAVPRLKLFTNYDQVVEPAKLEAFRALVKRAAEHEPIAYLTGRAFFFSLEFAVTPAVLIPRPDTETIVENVLQLARNTPGLEAPRILDLCTGSGCVAAAIAHHLKSASVIASDISAEAIAVANANFERLGLAGRIHIRLGDLYEALNEPTDLAPFHLIVANPPYIPSAEIPKLDRNVRDYEPVTALDGGPDGLDLHRRILAGAGQRLLPGGRIFLEIQFDHGPAALGLVAEHPGLADWRVLKDQAGNDRVLSARKQG